METVTIPKIEYKSLVEDRKWLNALEDAGVDNWEGIDFARELLGEQEEDEEDDEDS
jgi:hypothetical protein